MNVSRLVLAASVASSVALACTALPSSSESVGTAAAALNGPEAPTMNSVVFLGSCTGTLIAPNLVLTAVHCVSQLSSASKVTAVMAPGKLGATQDAAPGVPPNASPAGFELKVSEVRIAEDARTFGLGGNDVALLILATSATDATFVTPRFELPAIGDKVTFVGFGSLCQTCSVEQALFGDGGAGIRRTVTNVDVVCSGDCTAGKASDWGTAPTFGLADSGGPAFDSEGRVVGVISRTFSKQSICQGLAAHKDLIVQAAKDAAVLGGYAEPAWAKDPVAPAEEPATSGDDDDDESKGGDDDDSSSSKKKKATDPSDASSGGGCSMHASHHAPRDGGALGVTTLVALALVAARRRRSAR